MPVVLKTIDDPLFPPISSYSAMGANRAEHQDSRPLEVVMLVLMADKLATLRQFNECLGLSPHQINLTLVAPDSYVQKVKDGYEPGYISQEEFLDKFRSVSEVLTGRKCDLFLATGINPKADTVESEDLYPEMCDIFKRLDEGAAFSSAFVCWSSQAAYLYYHGIDSVKGSEKTYGVYGQQIVDDPAVLFPKHSDIVPAPVSFWKRPDSDAIKENSNLHIVATSSETGPTVVVETRPYLDDENTTRHYPFRTFITMHAEYDRVTLGNEHIRDFRLNPLAVPPANYYADTAHHKDPIYSWGEAANLYRNLVERIFRATRLDVTALPSPFDYDRDSVAPLANSSSPGIAIG